MDFLSKLCSNFINSSYISFLNFKYQSNSKNMGKIHFQDTTKSQIYQIVIFQPLKKTEMKYIDEKMWAFYCSRIPTCPDVHLAQWFPLLVLVLSSVCRVCTGWYDTITWPASQLFRRIQTGLQTFTYAKVKTHTVMMVQIFLKKEFSNNDLVPYINQKCSCLFSQERLFHLIFSMNFLPSVLQ